MRIIITGPKSAGKSTTSAKLAERLGLPYIDLDNITVELSRKLNLEAESCADIYRIVGEDKFRQIESEAVSELAKKDYCVIATGGSSLLIPGSRKKLRPDAIWFFLDASTEYLWNRLSAKPLPAFLEKSPDPLSVFSQRISLLKEVLLPNCDYSVSIENKSTEEIVNEIISMLSDEMAIRAQSPNTFGQLVRLTTFGESHGPLMGAVLDGVPPGLSLDIKDIQSELNRRRPGQSAVSTERKELDQVEIVSGVFQGKTTGTPIAMLIRNTDSRSAHYEEIKDIFRPGHADFTFWRKYGIRDYRGGGRSSGRETVSRVAGGAVARKILEEQGIKIRAYTVQIANIKAKKIIYDEISKNPVRCPDPEVASQMENLIVEMKQKGDSVGGIVAAEILGLPAGVGDPIFAKLDARLGMALLSIGAVKGVEFGVGFRCAEMRGSENNDQMQDGKFLSNNSGGILGGISTGEPIIIRLAVKATPSIAGEQKTCDINGNNKSIKVKGRHDPCIIPRIIPVVESMIALTTLDAIEIQKRLHN